MPEIYISKQKMAKSKDQKKDILKDYNDSITKSKGFIVLKPSKVSPNEANDFRKELFDYDASLKIVKNSIFKKALKENNLDLDLEKGEFAVLFINEDIVSPSKSLKKFIENVKTKDGDDKMAIISGVLDGSVLTQEQVTELSDMPDKAGSISLILGILDNAISGVVYVLEDAPRSVVNVLDQAFKE